MTEYIFRTNKPIKCCGDCPAIKSPAGFTGNTYYDGCSLDESLEVMAEERHENCPLVELLPHGDLIDRSKLVLHGRVDDFGDLQEMNDYYDATEVMNAPAILEASK